MANNPQLPEPRISEAQDLLADYKPPASLRRFLGTGTNRSSPARAWTRLGQASRMLRILRDYHSDASEELGIPEQSLKMMMVLQEAFPPIQIKGVQTAAKGFSQHESLSLTQFDLTDDQRSLCRALQTTHIIFHNRFLVLVVGSPGTKNDFVAERLKLTHERLQASLSEPITKEAFFKLAQFWFEVFIGSRTKYAHPHESTSQLASDLEFLIDHKRTNAQSDSPKKLFISGSLQESLNEIKALFLSSGKERA